MKKVVKRPAKKPAAKAPATAPTGAAESGSAKQAVKSPAKRPVKKKAVKRAVKKAAKRPVKKAATAPVEKAAAVPVDRKADRAPGGKSGKRPTERTSGRPAAKAAPKRARSSSVAVSPSLADRLLEPVDTSGRKTLLGILWIVALVASLRLGVLAMGILFGLVGAVAGLHGARSWRRRGWPVNRVVAGGTPLLAGIAVGIGNGAAGAVMLGGVVATVVTSMFHMRRVRILDTAGSTLRSWLPSAVTAISIVAVYRVSLQAAVGLILLSLSYDVGAYVWGAGVHRPLASRIAGIVTVLVATFALAVVHMVLELPPFESSAAVLVFGALAAVCCPLGQIVVSASLPTARDSAPALRRLDSLVIAAPAWAMALWSSLG